MREASNRGWGYLAADSPLLFGVISETLQLAHVGLLAQSLPTTNHGECSIEIKGEGTYPGRGMSVEAQLRFGSVLGVARGLFVSDVGDESFEESGDRAGTSIGGGGAGGSSGVGGGLLVSELMLGGGVIELLFRHDTVGEACLGGCHEDDH